MKQIFKNKFRAAVAFSILLGLTSSYVYVSAKSNATDMKENHSQLPTPEFENWDADMNGCIDEAEFGPLQDYWWTTYQSDITFEQVDTDANGCINEDEYWALWGY